MPGQRPSQYAARPKGKSPAERSEEFTAEQRRLKEEAADRREAAAAKGPKAKPTQHRRG
jgi:hypothetical protein